jgi:hypothetical protein
MAAIDAGTARNIWTEGALAPEVSQPAAPRRLDPRPASRAADARAFRRGVGAIALAGAMLSAVAAGSAAVVTQSAAVSNAQATIASLQGQDRTLTVRLAELENPDRIERIATQRLGLQRPSAYIPVPTGTLPPAPIPSPGHSATALVNVPAGPAPGGAVALWRQGMDWAQTHIRLMSGRKLS